MNPRNQILEICQGADLRLLHSTQAYIQCLRQSQALNSSVNSILPHRHQAPVKALPNEVTQKEGVWGVGILGLP